jgi:N-dimethylarginine dimethylaminohydrolase
VDEERALVRQEIIHPGVVRLLEDRGYEIMRVPENDEVRHRQAMNIVTVAPSAIIMPSSCPATRRVYEDAGLTVKATLAVDEMVKGGGGLACATAVIAREP